MSKIIFLILPIFILNLYKIHLHVPSSSYFKSFIRTNKNEYYIFYLKMGTNLLIVDAKTDNIIYNERIFYDKISHFKQLKNNINIYNFGYYLIIYNNGKENKITFGTPFCTHAQYQISNANSLLIGSTFHCFPLTYQGIELTLIKEPYNKIYKYLFFERQSNYLDNYLDLQLIGLKNYYIDIRYDQNYLNGGNYTYNIFDLDLNLINSITYNYVNYSEIIFSELSENKEIDEFIICKRYNAKAEIECQIVKCEGSSLIFLETFKIFSYNKFDGSFSLYMLTVNLLDGNKVGFYLLNPLTYNSKYMYDYITIIQYENQTLFYYDNIKDIQIPKIIRETDNHLIKMVMTNKGIGILCDSGHLLYLSSICLTKNITLYTNSLLEFPIEEFIIPGIEQLEFSFEEIHEGLTIYKNSSEIKIGQVFHDLSNFTYFLDIINFFNDSFMIKVRNHKYDYVCDINITIIINTTIKTYKEKYTCFRNKNYDEINNIIYSNLFGYFTFSYFERFFQLEFILEKEPKDTELTFYYEDYVFICTNDNKKIICQLPFILFPKYKKLHLYSYLSCYNLIDVGWFQINDDDILGAYELINYNFNEISKLYDPKEKITEYCPEMINYYYWFSCFAYCDDKNIGSQFCCKYILDEWEVVFHKEYSNDKNIFELFMDLLDQISSNPDLNEFAANNFDFNDYVTDLIGESSDNIGTIVKKLKDANEKISLVIPFLSQLLTFIYQYNFVILKNDKYKKIVVAFPGITYYFQIIEEIISAGMIQLPIKSEKKIFHVLEMYYNIFTNLEDDLFDNLKSLPEVMDNNYQIIFVGHSLGGAIATISSFYYIKKYKFSAENILITFGQPRVGSESFAKELTNDLKQIYRIARPNDIATQFPFKGIDFLFTYIKTINLFIEIVEIFSKLACGNYIGYYLSLYNFFSGDIVEKYSYLFQSRTLEDSLYSHIGGLYMIEDDTNTVYHCKDFFNEKRDHFICKNHKMKFSLSIVNDFFRNRNYLSLNQHMINNCQRKTLTFFRFSSAFSGYNNLLRRLEIDNNINKKNKYNIPRKRKLDNLQDIQETILLFKEINLDKKKYEYCFKYESQEILKTNNLFLLINPKNNHFFAEICFSQNISWLISNELDLIACYFINIRNPFFLNINLEKEIIDEKELYIYIKGKVSGTLELYDITKNKTMNLSFSYYIPFINNNKSEIYINYLLPKIEENIYINIIINDYGSNKNISISEILEVYKDNNKTNYDKNYFMLEKDKEYYFKYYPNKYELIINFIPIYSNKLFRKGILYNK